MHGIVMFHSQGSVNAVMSQRSHQIDGKEVFIHRSVPNQGSLKDNKAIQRLIVSSPTSQSLVESDINSYFSQYGKICNISHMNNEDNTWVIHFDYYDSVDQVLLDSPHCIGGIDVNVKKDNRNFFRRRSTTPGATPNTAKNDIEVRPKKSNLKQVTMNEQISCLSLPAKKYRIHVTNLPANIDAETLSQEFDWDIYDIVMDPSTNDRALPAECWLKNANDEREVNSFIQSRNGRSIRGSIIQCEKEEDEIELCNKFQFGLCEKSSDECHWEHIRCTAMGTCSSICPYGHPFGMKTGHDSPNNRLPSDVPADEWEITKNASNSDGKVLLIRGKADRKRLAVIKIYPNQSSMDLYREVTVMKDLKDVKGVSQLIEPENTSNNLTQRHVDKTNLWMIMKRAPEYSLKEFIERKYHGAL
ncbi:unnamed protein product [Rotaria sordida]|nr:unnamed protein product [Rotaria sordida]